MDTKKKQSVIPIYAVGLVWLSRAISGHLSSFGGIISTIVLSAVAFGVLKIFFPDKVEQTDGADKSAPNVAKPEEKKQPEPKQDSTPKPEEKKQSEPSTGNPELDAILKQGAEAVSKIQALNDEIPDFKLSAQIKQIEILTEKIFAYVKEHPQDMGQIRQFLNYYLPTTIKLLEQYVVLQNQGMRVGNIDEGMTKIENMLEQNRQLRAKREAEKKDMGMLAICAGEGLAGIFKDLCVDKVIEGGQTMNPTAGDIASAAQKINARDIFIFPNNKNIILAAEQAKDLVENRTIHVIPTKNVPQGFAAALQFNPEVSVEENKVNMIHELDNVKAGQVTYAVRDTSLNGFSISKGDVIGLDDKKILAKSQNIPDTVLKLLNKMKEDSHEMITLYYGEGVSEEDAAALAAQVGEKYPDCDVDFHFGGQPVYYYIISLE